MKLTKWQSAYPDGRLPAILEKVARYCEQLNASFSAEFEFDCSPECLEGLPHRNCFAPFGTDGCGGLWAFWCPINEHLTSSSILQTPIVFISSEAVDSTVVASSFEEFLSILAIGCENLGDKASQDDEISYSAECKGSNVKNRAFRNWLYYELGIEASKDPNSIVTAAKRRYGRPFVEWFLSWQEDAPWTRGLLPND